MKEVIGACLGASSISLVRLKKDHELISVEDSLSLPHNGDPRKIFKEKLFQFASAQSINQTIIQPACPEGWSSNHTPGSLGQIPVVVTGRKFRKLVKFTNISEPEAT